MKKASSITLGFIMLLTLCALSGTYAQTVKDTILITSQHLNMQLLKPSVNRYLIYRKMGIDSPRVGSQFWTSTISYGDYNGREAIIIACEQEGNDTVIYKTTTICDRKTMAPLHQENWMRRLGKSSYDYVNKTAVYYGVPISDADTARNRKGPWDAFKSAFNQYTLTWHLDLEIFSLLPYKANRTFLIPFYEPGSTAPKNEAFAITGSAVLEAYDHQKVDCWLLSHETRVATAAGESVSNEVYWVSKKGKEVLKMEQIINGTRWRYKIKLGFGM